ncbi:Hypothetical protein CINCED_3A004360 [Cinara cedri]|nr:Hypothetical protein CINCED_3A004360 [Cinara cedri]
MENNKYLIAFEELNIRNILAFNLTQQFISSPDVQKFIKEDQSTFDLVIVESFFQQCTVAMGHKYRAPVINIIPVSPCATHSISAANPFDFSYIKDYKTDSGKSLNFQNRLLNTFFGLYTLFVEPIIYNPKMENMMNTYFKYPGYETRPTMTEMLKNVSLSLIDSDVMILSSRPYVPSFIEVPGIHFRPPKKMNKELQEYMDTATKGVVFLNFGTVINMDNVSKHTLDIFKKVLGRLEQKVIFRWTNNDTQGFPDNFYVDSWLPQVDILKHPNCKLFITHGGIHGLMETIDAGVPFIGFPVFGDQHQNLRISQENGFGIVGNIFSLTEEAFERDVKLVLFDLKFTENAKRMSLIFNDRPMPSMEKAVYWIEYVIRHKGAHHLRSPAVELVWYQYYSLDIFAFIISIILFLIFICYPLFFAPIKSSNILVFVPSPWKSHLVSFQPLFLELAHRGHNVTVVTKFAVDNPPANYRQVIVEYEMNLTAIEPFIFKETNIYEEFFKELYIRNIISQDLTQQYISSSNVQSFIKEDQSTFDLVIVESFFQECTIAMGHKYSAPVISIIPLAPWAIQSVLAANPFDFSYIKDFKIDSGKSLNFQNRLFNTLFGLYALFVAPIIYNPKMENMMNTYFKYPGYKTRPTMTEMLKNVSLSLIDSDVMILSSRPYVPSFIEVPGIHFRPVKNMDKKLQDFMDTATKGVVFLNFGTLINMDKVPKPTLDIFKKVLGRLEQKVIFKWTNNDTQGFPDNFYVDSWLPQVDILKHPNCKLFITHGGIHGLMETIDAGVPFIGFPVFGDQHQNLRISQENGFGIMSNIMTLTENTFERDVGLVLNEPSFKENAMRMSLIFNDRPLTSIDKAVYWVEYVIRHKGAHHLRSPAVELVWYQYYSLDIFAFIISIILFLIFIFYRITKLVIKSIFNLLFKTTKLKLS